MEWPRTEDVLALIAEVEGRAPLADSLDHGSHHWRLVAWTGAELLPTVPTADPLVVFLFALFHDSQRENEFRDPAHGRRGAALARELLPKRLSLDEQRLEILWKACSLHTEAPPTTDVTLGTCWDSDRLNLWRVGIVPSTRYLSTDEGKKAGRIEWARELQERDFDWTRVWSRYGELISSDSMSCRYPDSQ